MVHLLDVNVLLALGWPRHEHHEAATNWMSEHAADGWATCVVTQLGFIRLSANPRVIVPRTTPVHAVRLLQSITEKPGHVFWPDAVSPTEGPSEAWNEVWGHQQITDVCLTRLAARKGGRVATFDRPFAASMPEHVVLIGS